MGCSGFKSGFLALIATTLWTPCSTASFQSDLAAPTDVYPDWAYAGCYTDNVAKRTLSENSGLSQHLTNEECVAYCAGHGYIYAGTEYSQECYCGRVLQNGGSLAVESDCNMACNGDSSQPCGGSNRLTLFSTTLASEPVVNPGVNGYQSLGCYTDNVLNRTLSQGVGLPGGTNNVTVTACISTCQSGDFIFAGLEYSHECYCGNAILNNGALDDDASNCDMACSGNLAELCGGSNRLNLYGTRDVAPEGWTSLGCYTDSVATRTLANQQFSVPGDNMTNARCLAACQSGQYIYGGTEYGGECFCGNTILNSAGPAPDGNALCNVPCKGSTQETCGGPNRLSFFQFGSGAPVSSSSFTSASPSSSLTSTLPSSSMVSISASSSASTGPSSSSSALSTPTTSGTSATSTAKTTPSSVSTSTSSTTTPSAAGIPGGWSYKGCWIDNANGRIMGNQQPDNQTLTVQSCIMTCLNLGYSVAGLQYSSQCFCDDYLKNGATMADDTDCSNKCSGDSTQFCGGPNRDSVWSTQDDLQVYPVPSPQKQNLTGSWQYMGCLTDDAPNGLRALPYQIILNDNNTANNCLEQCSRFKYDGGGMEYGLECYCGTSGDVALANATLTSESDCNTACSGDPTWLCGGGRRLSFYTWNGPPLAEFSYPSGDNAGRYEFLIGGVVIPLITQAARNGKVTFLEKWGTGPPNTTGAYELDLASIDNFVAAWRPMHVKTDIFCSASLTLPDKAGRQLNVGGWALDSTFGVRLYWPDGSPGVWGSNDWQEDVQAVSLQNGRWYPTAMIMANGSVLVMGGEVGSNGAPMPTLEILPRAGPALFCDWLNRTDPNNLYPFPVVLPHGDIFVAYYNEAIILDEETLEVKQRLPNIPGAVNDFLAGRTYPLEGTAVLLPQYPPYDELEILICGGSTPFQGVALDNCVTINPEQPDADWVIERMPSKRVMSCMTALPDGTYLILNGAQQGFAGFGLGNDPNHNAVLYDPTAPVGSRMSVMANTTIDRLYHSEAILLDDGRVLVSGSDPEDDTHEQEYRVEVFIPPYLLKGIAQPNLQISNTDWQYGQTITLTASTQIVKVSLLGAGSSTHGNSMGQRTIFPAVSCYGTACSIVAPPNAHVCPPGWFQVFGLTPGGVPSRAVWVRIGGDPAQLGNWPNSTSFIVPGV